VRNLYDGVRPDEISQAMIFAAKARVELEPAYTFVAPGCCSIEFIARRCRKVPGTLKPRIETASRNTCKRESASSGSIRFCSLSTWTGWRRGFVRNGTNSSPTWGCKTLYDRYLIQHQGGVWKTPQYFWLRVAMGLALHEGDQKTAVPSSSTKRCPDFFLFRPRRHFSIPARAIPAQPLLLSLHRDG